jgi:hypothetical protein
MAQTLDTTPPLEAPSPNVETPVTDPHDAAAEPQTRRRFRVRGAHVLVVLVVAYNLWTLRNLIVVTAYPNDLAFHLQMATAANNALAHGHNPLTSWFPNLTLGSPLFVQYQSVSAILVGAVGLVVGVHAAFGWSLYLLLALWPLCIYWTSRLLGWGRWEAAVAAAVAPFLASVTGKGFEDRAFMWVGSGLWSELWAMWTLPLAIGFTWRYLSRRQYLFGAVAALSATIALHYLMGYLAALLVAVLIFLRPSELPRRLARGALVAGCTAFATLWVTLPLLAQGPWTSTNASQVGTPIDDSYGASAVMRWLAKGQLFDYGHRVPVITLLAAVGFAFCVLRFRRDERARVLVAMFTASLLLFFGRPTFGAVFDHLPEQRSLLFPRFVAGVDLAAILLAGVGAVVLVQALAKLTTAWSSDAVSNLVADRHRRLVGGLVAITCVLLVLSPAWLQTRTLAQQSAAFNAAQQQYDVTNVPVLTGLVDYAEAHGGGRIYAGLQGAWGSHFGFGYVPMYNFLESTNADAIGLTYRTLGTMSDPEQNFNDHLLGDYTVLGVHWVIMPVVLRPTVPSTLVKQVGGFRLFRVGAPGLFHVVDTQGTITANSRDLGPATKRFMASRRAGPGPYPTVAYGGRPAAADTLAPGPVPSSPAGRVLSEHVNLGGGHATAVVHASRRSVVLLSAAYNPGWSVTVDGRPATTQMVAPALLGVAVPAGTHAIAFTWHGYGSYPLLVVVAVLTLIGTAVGPALWRRRRGGAEAGAGDEVGVDAGDALSPVSVGAGGPGADAGTLAAPTE